MLVSQDKASRHPGAVDAQSLRQGQKGGLKWKEKKKLIDSFEKIFLWYVYLE